MSSTDDDNGWYWGVSNPEHVLCYLATRHDGTFVVYGSEENKDLMLAYRFKGQTKLVKILHRDNLYGFTEPLSFDSLDSALDAYNWSPTETGNTLLFPCVKPGTMSRCPSQHSLNPKDQLQLLRTIKHNAKTIAENDVTLERLRKEHAILEEKLNGLNCMNESLNRLLTILETQLNKHHEVSKNVPTTARTTKELSDNFMRLTSRIQEIHKGLEDNGADREHVEQECMSAYKNYSDINSQILEMKKEILTSKRLLLHSDAGVGVFIEKLLSDSTDHYIKVIEQDHLDNSKVKTRLQKESDGSFIVRRNHDSDTPFTLSVSQSGTVYHFPVYSMDGYLGLDKVTCVFDNIQELVLHYTDVPFGIHAAKYGKLVLTKQQIV